MTEKAGPRGRTWTAALPISLAVVVVLTELSYRVVLFGAAGLSIEEVNSVHDLGRSGLIERSPHREVVYQLKPNLRGFFKLAPFRTNSVGLADDEYPLEKAQGVFRIAVLGSSYSMPAGVSLEDSWHGRLERDLNAKRGRRRFEVINFAVGGYDLRQMLGTLRYRAAAYRPDLALVDLTRLSPTLLRPESVYRSPFDPHPPSFPFLHSFALEALIGGSPPADPVLPRDESQQAFDRALAELPKIAAELQLPICFVILQHEPWDPGRDDALRRDVARVSSCTIDTAPAFRGESFAHLILYAGDPHPNAKAHAIFESVILDAVRSSALVGGVS